MFSSDCYIFESLKNDFMKTLVSVVIFLFATLSVNAQLQSMWSADIPANPYLKTNGYFGSFMYDGKVFEIGQYIVNDSLSVSSYDPKVGVWKKKVEVTPLIGVLTSNVKFKQVQNKVYIFYFNSSSVIGLYIYDLSANTLTNINDFNYGGSVLGYFDVSVSSDQQKILLAVEDNGDLFVKAFDLPSASWESGYYFQPALTGQVYIYASPTKYYVGKRTANGDTLLTALRGSVASLTYYNNNDSNDGLVKYSTGGTISGSTFLVGNATGEPNLLVYDPASMYTFEKSLPTNGMNLKVNTATDTKMTFNLDPSLYAITNNSSYAYVAGNYATGGTNTFNAACGLYKKNLSTGVWTKVVIGDITGVTTLRTISADNASTHVTLGTVNAGVNQTKVSNKQIMVMGPDNIINSGTCANSENVIFRLLRLQDELEDGAIRFQYGNESANNIINIKARFLSFNGASPFAYSNFDVTGHIQNAGSNDLQMYFTDGFNNTNVYFPSLSLGSTTAPSVTLAPTVHLCSNDNSIDLTSFVTNYNPGWFRINQDYLPNSTLNGPVAAVKYINLGKIYFATDINGCIVQDSANFDFPTLATVNLTQTDAACGSNTGSASVGIYPGTSANYYYAWSTGETFATISNLLPGPYYFDVKDDYNCHVRGAAYIGATGITLQPIITNVSCNGLSDGAISVVVPNASAYQYLWSTGHTTTTISNLKAGSYSLTMWNNSGCQVTQTYVVTEPAAMNPTFSVFPPTTCGAATGSIYTSLSGGPYNYMWLGTGQTGPSLYTMPAGIYKVRIMDNNGCFQDFETVMNDQYAAIINGQVNPSTCTVTDGSISVNFSYNPNGGNLPTSWVWNTGQTTQNLTGLAVGNYTITAYSPYMGGMCKSIKKFTVGTKAPLQQPICLVTVDTSTTTNLVVWEKAEAIGIHHYNIYRESDVAGEFQLIDTVMAGNEPIFNDVVASPVNRSWRYRISAENYCGTEGPLSGAHKTLHLNAIENTGNGNMDIYWDDYEGSPDINGYVVWRYTDQAGWVQASSVIAPGTLTYQDTPPTGATGLDYFVAMELTNTCTAEKAQDFNTTRSNRERSNFFAGNGTGNSSNGIAEEYLNNLELYPNPTLNTFNIKQSEVKEMTIAIKDVSGKLLMNHTSNELTTTIDISSMKSGVYFIEIQIDGVKSIRKVSKL